MTFSHIELASIIKLATLMAKADGNVAEEELEMISNELLRFGVSPNDLKNLLIQSSTMEVNSAITHVQSMTEEEKKYVSSYLGTLMSIDGVIDESEMKLWRLISTICSLPTMNIKEAITNMSNL